MNNNRVGKRHKNSRLWATAFGLLVLLALSACALAQEKTAESWYKSGQELEKMGSWKEAVDAYDQAIILNPDYKEAWCAKCKALSIANLELSGQEQNTTFAKAIQACDRALEIDPDDPGQARASSSSMRPSSQPIRASSTNPYWHTRRP